MSYDLVQKELAAKKYRPVYFVHGEEPYYIDLIDDFLSKNILTDDDKAFNLHILYGKDSNMAQLLSLAKQYPVMAERQVVMLREAQSYKKDDWEMLQSYLDKPVESTILFIGYKGKLDERTKFSKVLKEKKLDIKSEPLADAALPGFVKTYLGTGGYSINDELSHIIAESVGKDLGRITNELDKMMINMGGEKQVNSKHIEDNIGISREYNSFELVKALGTKQSDKVYKILAYMMANIKKTPLLLIIGALYPFFSKLLQYQLLNDADRRNAAQLMGVPAFFLKDYTAAARFYSAPKLFQVIELLHEYDLKSKGMNTGTETEEQELLKELVFRVMN